MIVEDYVENGPTQVIPLLLQLSSTRGSPPPFHLLTTVKDPPPPISTATLPLASRQPAGPLDQDQSSPSATEMGSDAPGDQRGTFRPELWSATGSKHAQVQHTSPSRH
ncbi:hypothetical protein PAMP_000759 [Pampus punctatissimus]